VAQQQAPAGVPVFEFDKAKSSIGFNVKASVAIGGKFAKWDATITFTSPDVTTGVLDIIAQATSVDTGSGMKDGKLRGKDFFDAEHNPLITFHSTKIVQTGANSFEIPGAFTIRGVSKPETLTAGGFRGTGQGEVEGIMAFDRKDYGMNSGIPFIKIADRVEAALWTGHQAELHGQASKLRVEAEEAAKYANQERLYNASTVVEWLKAEAHKHNEKKLADLAALESSAASETMPDVELATVV
jgi:polyisoprenoid-binding protein YceI